MLRNELPDSPTFNETDCSRKPAGEAQSPLIRWLRTLQVWVARHHRFTWTLGNLFLLTGVYLLLYIGGVYAQIDYNRLAARGDNDLPVSIETTASFVERTPESVTFNVPVLNTGQILKNDPAAAQAPHVSTVSRIVIPSVALDYKVVEVGWRIEELAEGPVAVWEVAEYAVGQHKGSANPGEGSNIVLAGHVGGYGRVFRDLFYVHPGDEVTLYSEGQQYLYVIQERLVLEEENVPPEQRAANAQYMAPTDTEMLTLITCWPATGPDRFTQRVVVRAVPYGAMVEETGQPATNAWNVR